MNIFCINPTITNHTARYDNLLFPLLDDSHEVQSYFRRWGGGGEGGGLPLGFFRKNQS